LFVVLPALNAHDNTWHYSDGVVWFATRQQSSRGAIGEWHKRWLVDRTAPPPRLVRCCRWTRWQSLFELRAARQRRRAVCGWVLAFV